MERQRGCRPGKRDAVGSPCMDKVFFVVEYAVAEIGACGLETGMWAAPKDACLYSDQPEEVAKQFGKEALLEWRLGHYRFEGANCAIFSDKLAGTLCTLRVECLYQGLRTLGEWGIEVQTAQQFRFGTRPDSPIYHHCAGLGTQSGKNDPYCQQFARRLRK